jgi:SAM-dependent methyltransferase
MPIPQTYSFARYLSAKKSVDDRALNQCVWQSLMTALPRATPEQPLQILEVGAGLGTMVERLVASGMLTHATYTAIDLEPTLIAEARRRLPQWATAQGWQAQQDSQVHAGPGGHEIHMQRPDQDIRVATEAIDLVRFVAREQGQRTWDLLIAQALLDLVDVPTTLPGLLSLLRPGGLLYCPITFDGGTVFQPEIDLEFDAAIEACYHQTMNRRLVAGKPSGDSRTGRHLFTHLRAAGAEVLAAGSSDWVVFAGPNGYVADEAYFLYFIIHTMHTALAGHPDLDAERLTAWIAQRHAQVEQGTLVYIAHQLDLLGRVSAPSGGTKECNQRKRSYVYRATHP